LSAKEGKAWWARSYERWLTKVTEDFDAGFFVEEMKLGWVLQE